MKTFFAIALVILGIHLKANGMDITGTIDAIGEQKVAVVLLDLINDPNVPSPSDVQAMVFDAELSVNSFIKESSYGRTWLSGKVFGWYRPTNTNRCDVRPAQFFDIINSTIKFKDFDRFLVLVQHNPNCPALALGASTFGRVPFNTPQGKINVSLSWAFINHYLSRPQLPNQKLAKITGTVLAHELGHGFGILAHSNIYDCDTEAVSANPNLCKQEGIADMFVIMGGEGFTRASLHHSACHKEDLGWLDASNMRTIGVQEQSTRINLYPYEVQNKNGPVAVKITLAKPITIVQNVEVRDLYLEYRTPIGFNSRLKDLPVSPISAYPGLTMHPPYYDATHTGINTNGIQIRGGFSQNGHCHTSYLIDTKPRSLSYQGDPYSLYGSLDGFLNPGERFFEPNNRISIETISNNADGSITVLVSRNQ